MGIFDIFGSGPNPLANLFGGGPAPQGAAPQQMDISSMLGGAGDRLGAGLMGFANSGAPLPAIANLLSGLMTGQRSDPAGVSQRMLQQKQVSLFNALRARGMSKEDALAAITNPEYEKSLLPAAIPKHDFHNVDGVVGSFNPYNPGFNVHGSVPKPQTVSEGSTLGTVTPSFIPSPQQRPLMAPGSTAPIVPNAVPTSRQPPVAPQASLPAPGATPSPAAPNAFTPLMTGQPKPPEGKLWVDPTNQSKGVTDMPGMQKPLPANEAGILAMMQSANQGVKQARDYYLSPEFKSGPIDTAGKAIGQATESFDIGRHRRSIGLATEAALRLATGAAAPESEVKRYANFYTPSVYDSEATRTQKIDALQRFMAYAERNMMSGRGIPITDVPPPAAFVTGGSAAGTPKAQERVSKPAWPAPPKGFELQ